MLSLVLCCSAAFLARAVLGQNQLVDFCRRFEHRTTVVNNKLYIDGGKYNINPNVTVNHTNADLFYSDLLTVGSMMGMPAMHYAPSKDATVPSIAGGALWADEINSRFYAFGGYHVTGDPPSFLTWSYDTSRDMWEKVTTTGDATTYVAHGMSAIAPDAGKAFYLGGYHDNTTNRGWTATRRYTPNLVEFDLVGRRYTNHSGPDSDGRGEGLMVFIPASNSGLLIYFGGVLQSQVDGKVAGLSMDKIWIYDISLRKWYQQIATGDVPDSRSRFCGAAAWPDDKSSYNIYLYGGLHQNGTAFDDLYLLSLPSFVWIKLYPTDANTQIFGHHSMTCDIINGTQMIVMGGTFPTTDMCDSPDTQGQHNVDMGTIIEPGQLWQIFNQNNPPYRVPDVLVKVIGGTIRGAANATRPASDRTYDQYLFEKEYKVPQRYPTPITTPSETAAAKANALDRGTLIGAIVGSIACGVLIGLALFYLVGFLRRRARSERGKKEGAERRGDAEKHAPDELHGHDINEVGTAKAVNEVGSGRTSLAEMWTEPVELGCFEQGGPGRGRAT